MKTFTAYVEWDAETNLYVGIVPGVPGAQRGLAVVSGRVSRID